MSGQWDDAPFVVLTVNANAKRARAMVEWNEGHAHDTATRLATEGSHGRVFLLDLTDLDIRRHEYFGDDGDAQRARLSAELQATLRPSPSPVSPADGGVS